MGRERYRIAESLLEGPSLIGSECGSCHAAFFPQKHVCPLCAKEGPMIEKPLSRTGKIYSFSYCRVGPPGVKAPYVIGLVDLSEGPRVVSIIAVKEPSPTALKMGDEVELIIGKTSVDEQGQDIINYMFKPVKDRTAPATTRA